MGTAFKYKFQRILEVKERQQQALEMELARLDILLQEKQAALARWRHIRGGTIDDQRRARLEGDLDLDARYGDYLAYVKTRKDQCKVEQDELSEARERVRSQLEQLMQACKVLEKYRDRLHKEFVREKERAEEKVLDLHSLYRFIEAEEPM